MAVSAQAQPASRQTIEAYVGEQMDNARMGPLHWRVLALVAGGYFCDVIDFTIFGALVPDLLKSGFVTQQQVPWVGSATALGMVIGTLGQGEFTDRFGRKTVYQFNLLLFGLATIAAALAGIHARRPLRSCVAMTRSQPRFSPTAASTRGEPHSVRRRSRAMRRPRIDGLARSTVGRRSTATGAPRDRAR
jgi:hypothetical protein